MSPISYFFWQNAGAESALESVIEAVTRHREIGGFVRDDRRRYFALVVRGAEQRLMMR